METKIRYNEDEMAVGRLVQLKNELREVLGSIWQTNNSIGSKLRTISYFSSDDELEHKTKDPETLLDEIEVILIGLHELDKSLDHNYNHLKSIV